MQLSLNKKHFVIVIFYCLYALIVDLIFASKFNFSVFFAGLLVQFWLFYTFYYSLVCFFSKKPNRILYALSILIVSFIGAYILNYFLFYVAYSFQSEKVIAKDVLYNLAQLFGQICIYSIGLYFSQLIIQAQREISNFEKRNLESVQEKLQLENKNLLLEEDKASLQIQLLESEINFLRAQISPHFLFNCLNFLYSEILEVQPKAAEGVLILSQIMRYSLKDFSKSGGSANLEEELEHIENVIQIHQMRFANALNIKLTVAGEVQNVKLVPMILITLVENIFKHGNLQDENIAAEINCTVNRENNKIIFSTSNAVRMGTSTTSSGIGIANIKQRLSQLYKTDYSFCHSVDDNIFKTEIIFPYHKTGQIESTVFATSKILV